MKMHRDMEEILFSEEQLADCVRHLAQRITRDYEGRDLLVVGILQGSFVFMADLVRAIELPLRVEFMAVSSYGGGTSSSGQLEIRLDMREDIKGRDILIVEDILDSGNTLARLLPKLRARGAASVKVCCLLDKPDRRRAAVQIDYLGFSIPDAFVVGYGLDYNQCYRNLPYVGVLRPAVYGACVQT